MAETDITTMATLVNGATGYGPASRGAFLTLGTRSKPLETQFAMTHTASGTLTVDWANGNYFKVSSNAFNVTALAQSNAPTGNTLRFGIIEFVNTSATTSLTLDFSAVSSDIGIATVPANGKEIVFIVSTGS